MPRLFEVWFHLFLTETLRGRYYYIHEIDKETRLQEAAQPRGSHMAGSARVGAGPQVLAWSPRLYQPVQDGPWGAFQSNLPHCP